MYKAYRGSDDGGVISGIGDALRAQATGVGNRDRKAFGDPCCGVVGGGHKNGEIQLRQSCICLACKKNLCVESTLILNINFTQTLCTSA